MTPTFTRCAGQRRAMEGQQRVVGARYRYQAQGAQRLVEPFEAREQRPNVLGIQTIQAGDEGPEIF